LFFRTAVHNMYLSAESECSTGSVHGYVSAAYYRYLVSLCDRSVIVLIEGLHQIVSGQIFIRGEYAAGRLARDSHELGKSRSGADEYGVKAFLLHQLVDGHRLSYNHVCLNLYAERFYIFHLGQNYAVLG